MAKRVNGAQVSPFGWVEISDTGLQRLRRELEEKAEGVVDEMGLLSIHTGYADYFFPGTSVLQTRPRYLFFVCWNLLWLAKERVTTKNLMRRKDEADLWVTRQLVTSDGIDKDGIIGVRVFQDDPTRLPAQRVDFVYWTALRVWGFYRSETAQARARLFRRWRAASIRRVGDAGGGGDDVVIEDPLAELHVPPVPDHWQEDDSPGLDFELTAVEARWLQERLMALDNFPDGPCLLAKAAELCSKQAPRVDGDEGRDLRPWNDPLVIDAARASGHVARLERARQASKLAHYVRAIYAALVEWLVVSDGATSYEYRDRLDELASDPVMRDAALGLSLEELYADVPRIPESLRRVLGHVQVGLARVAAGEAASDVFVENETHQLFEVVERRRKGGRARLPRTDAGAARRVDAATIGVYDIDYRWKPVRNLLSDLHRGLGR